MHEKTVDEAKDVLIFVAIGVPLYNVRQYAPLPGPLKITGDDDDLNLLLKRYLHIIL